MITRIRHSNQDNKMANRTSTLNEYDTSQMMIDINIHHLEGLRTQCELTAELTQIEIRALESKLLKLFGKQLMARQAAAAQEASSPIQSVKPIQTRLWLKIVGLREDVAEKLLSEVDESFERLIHMPTVTLQQLVKRLEMDEEQQRRILDSTRNVNTFIECAQADSRTANELDLHWDSWDRQLELPMERHSSASMVIGTPGHSRDTDANNFRSCPTSPPLYVGTASSSSASGTMVASQTSWHGTNGMKEANNSSRSASPLLGNRKEFDVSRRFPPPTPPNVRKNNYNINTTSQATNNAIIDLNNLALTKSRSHEEKLTNRVDPEHSTNGESRRRLATEPGGIGRASPLLCSPIRSPPGISLDTGSDSCFDDPPSLPPTSSTVSQQSTPSVIPQITHFPPPRSPRAHGGMMHAIHHRFVNTMKITSVPCDLCQKPMIFGFKCKECKYRCHRECVSKVPPSCGLPSELVSIFRETMNARIAAAGDAAPSVSSYSPSGQSPLPPVLESGVSSAAPQHTPHMLRKARVRRSPAQIQLPFGANLDSSSNSSCNSSSASSPALNITNQQQSPQRNAHLTSNTFTFPDPPVNHQPPSGFRNEFSTTAGFLADHDLQRSNTANLEVNSVDVLISSGSNAELEGSQSSDIPERAWPRQNSLSLREWDIPYDELKLDRQIGRGRFGTVYKGNWHGLVAVKMFSVSNSLDAGSALQAFKLDVATFRKTRHENLVLFMGACMKPPRLAIVTSFCKGHTLFSHIHERKERFPLASLVSIAQQISQGMGYLHARGILHKDLKSSNIFFDSNNNKVTITDFGLFSLTKLCIVNKNKDQLLIPKGWLCYLAPELIRMLRTESGYEQDDLPFSIYTDVYSFGTVWHELLSGCLPFKGQPAEVVIWQVGKGIKQSFRNLQASKEIKDILMLCWAYRDKERPDFVGLGEIFKHLPKRRLQRSPSHPTHLLRSLESLF